jgi:glutathione S-transferase
MSHQSAEYSPHIAALTAAISELAGTCGLSMADAASAIADALLVSFVEIRLTHGDEIVPEMLRFAERVTELAHAPTAQAMAALSDHLADADVPGKVQ